MLTTKANLLATKPGLKSKGFVAAISVFLAHLDDSTQHRESGPFFAEGAAHRLCVKSGIHVECDRITHRKP